MKLQEFRHWLPSGLEVVQWMSYHIIIDMGYGLLLWSVLGRMEHLSLNNIVNYVKHPCPQILKQYCKTDLNVDQWISYQVICGGYRFW